MKHKNYFFLFVCILLIVVSCRKKNIKPTWDAELLAPLATTSLNIGDIATDSFFQSNADSSLSLVFQNSLYEFNMDSILDIGAISYADKAKLDSLKIDSFVLNENVTLGDVATSIGGAIGAFIIFSNGTSQTIPAFNSTSTITSLIDATATFQNMVIISGTLEVKATNNFPIDLDNIAYNLENQSAMNIFLADTISTIAANGGTYTRTFDLAGKTIEGLINLNILSFSTPGSGSPVLINLNDDLVVELKIKDIKVSSATAVFPNQTFSDDTTNIPVTLGFGAQLQNAVIQSATINIQISSTIEEQVTIDYQLPSVSIAGVPFSASTIVPPAPSGGSVAQNLSYDLSGYDLDFTGRTGTNTNMLYNILFATINSSGTPVSLSLNDSFAITITLSNLVPQYATGYLGTQTFNVNGINTIDAFDNIKAGTIDLKDLIMTLNVTNGVGVDGGITINSISSSNTKNVTTANLSGSIVGANIMVNPATDMPLTPSLNTIVVDNSNSNAKTLIEIFPDQLQYDIDIAIDPAASVVFNDFIYQSSRLNVALDIEMPLDMISSGLALCDTVDFNLSGVKNPQNILDGTISLIADNTYPFDAVITLYVLDVSDNITDSILFTPAINAAMVGLDGKTIISEQSIVKADLNAAKTQKLLQSNRLIMSAAFTTQPNSQYVKIYDFYQLDLKLIGDFNYRVNQ